MSNNSKCVFVQLSRILLLNLLFARECYLRQK